MDPKTIDVLGNRVLIEPIDKKTESVILRPDGTKPLNKENYDFIIVRVGDGPSIPAKLVVGAKVLIRAMGFEIIVDAEKKKPYLLASSEDILCVFNE